MTRRALLALFVTLVLPAPLLPQSLASVAVCDAEDGIFWGAVDFVGGQYIWEIDEYGAYGEIKISDRDLNPACGVGGRNTGSTTIVLKDTSGYDWIEVGYEEACSNSDCTGHKFRWFVEAGIGGNVTYEDQGGWSSWPCTFPGVGTFMGFRVTEIIGQTNWNLKVNCLDGSGDHTVATGVHVTYLAGIPMNETWRLGGSKTGMSDDHRNLQLRPGDYTSWTAWPHGGLCWSDFASSGTNNWNGYMYSTTEYKTIKQSQNSCPMP
jgi:hypothetical protein